MPRLMGVELPANKNVEIALTYIYGIGRSLAKRIVEGAGIPWHTKVNKLTEEDLRKLREQIEKNGYKVEGELRREIATNIRRLIDIGCYRGIRHLQHLPVRGQRTRTNARQRKGPRKTVGATKGKK